MNCWNNFRILIHDWVGWVSIVSILWNKFIINYKMKQIRHHSQLLYFTSYYNIVSLFILNNDFMIIWERERVKRVKKNLFWLTLISSSLQDMLEKKERYNYKSYNINSHELKRFYFIISFTYMVNIYIF